MGLAAMTRGFARPVSPPGPTPVDVIFVSLQETPEGSFLNCQVRGLFLSAGKYRNFRVEPFALVAARLLSHSPGGSVAIFRLVDLFFSPEQSLPLWRFSQNPADHG